MAWFVFTVVKETQFEEGTKLAASTANGAAPPVQRNNAFEELNAIVTRTGSTTVNTAAS